jgi:hypothetical protein
MKFIFPPLWSGGFGAGTIALFLGAFHGQNDAPAPDWMKWQFLAMWIAGSAFIWWGCVRLKKVQVDDSALYVTNYLKEICIPFDQVRSVTENAWINIHPITIHFHESTPFGDRIVFMPMRRWYWPWRSHPIVVELRGLAQL